MTEIYLYYTPGSEHAERVSAHADVTLQVQKFRENRVRGKTLEDLVGVSVDGYRLSVVLRDGVLYHPSRVCIESPRLDERLRSLVGAHPGRTEPRDVKVWGHCCGACSGRGESGTWLRPLVMKGCEQCAGRGWAVGKGDHAPDYFGTPVQLDEQATYWANQGI